MGIVLKQSLNNTIITYLGFGIGAINTLFLYTRFLTDEYYGLVGVILSASAVLMPIMAFGVPNTLVKYYSNFKNEKTGDGFLTLMLLLPLFLIIPIVVIAYVANDAIGSFISKENPIVKGYVWHIFLIGMAMAYFEIFYAWAKVYMKSVFGNFMKEVFVRVGIMVLLLLVYLNYISVDDFLMCLVLLYMVRMVIMKIYAYRLRMPKISFNFPSNTKVILEYSALIILGGSAAVVLLEMDKVMINQFVKIENVAYYSVAIFIATVISVPSRSMHQIVYPLTAELLNKKDIKGLKDMYHRSSLTLFIISGIVYLLIILNLEDLYLLLPKEYSNGFFVVFLIGLAKVYDAALGNNNAILYNSDYYRAVLVMGVFLAIITIIFNLWLIPEYGLFGAAIATFISLILYNTIKVIFVKLRFGVLPFTFQMFKVFVLLCVLGVSFYFIPLPFNPIINIGIKSILIIAVYVVFLYKLNVSEDITGVITKYFKK
ncbi:polysaccharide biosynthesis C-terminal domain-containing protein [Cellulophaga sp. HaHaR_3_176]|uniref:oligosaccharide flippase family protein n=1 Tax=Cellulophaga sp. HaHaR_3_176 TaxID=1942464 RepID=UPI001C1FA524|nr:polysaccharide biosynthesis C-terminal domain-containing protein [Cellulophaga sp. HaHaR_3_176]QWX85430.1 polysaccharide biosynthesis C-terminal domain-containing protein [Cellulophaga sp. HaHaR_3_176]